MPLTYIGEWLTLDQAAQVLGITRAELRPLWQDGHLELEQIRPGIWRARTATVYGLANSPEWKDRTK